MCYFSFSLSQQIFLLLEFEVDMLQAIVAIEDTSVVWAKMGLSVLSRIEISACAAVLLG
jgi:hypothetical protein